LPGQKTLDSLLITGFVVSICVLVEIVLKVRQVSGMISIMRIGCAEGNGGREMRHEELPPPRTFPLRNPVPKAISYHLKTLITGT
jgi:hypothetical protein